LYSSLFFCFDLTTPLSSNMIHTKCSLSDNMGKYTCLYISVASCFAALKVWCTLCMCRQPKVFWLSTVFSCNTLYTLPRVSVYKCLYVTVFVVTSFYAMNCVVRCTYIFKLLFLLIDWFIICGNQVNVICLYSSDEI